MAGSSTRKRVFNFISASRNENRTYDVITEKLPSLSLRESINKIGYARNDTIKKWGTQLLEGLIFLNEVQRGQSKLMHSRIGTDDLYICEVTGDLKIDTKAILIQPLLKDKDEVVQYTEEDDMINFGMLLIEMLTHKQIDQKYMSPEGIDRLLE